MNALMWPVAVMALALAGGAPAADTETATEAWRIDAGFAGVYRAGSWTPVVVSPHDPATRGHPQRPVTREQQGTNRLLRPESGERIAAPPAPREFIEAVLRRDPRCTRGVACQIEHGGRPEPRRQIEGALGIGIDRHTRGGDGPE